MRVFDGYHTNKWKSKMYSLVKDPKDRYHPQKLLVIALV